MTSAARTVIDIARTEEEWRAVAIADAALHSRIVTVTQLSDALARIAGQPGRRKAVAALGLADGRSESVGESRMRVTLRGAGVTGLELQFDVADRHGSFIGWVDAGYPGRAVAIEFDGEVKYGRLLRPGETREDVEARQYQRQTELEAVGFVVVRVRWADLDDPAGLSARIRDALVLGDQRVSAGEFTARYSLTAPQRLP